MNHPGDTKDRRSAGKGRDSLLQRCDRLARRWATSVIYELRRTRRQIVSPETRVRGEPPIFVLGANRSGTTLLRLVLDSHSRIACPPESYFIRSLGHLLDDAKAMEGLLAMGFDEQHVAERLRETISYFFEMYAASHGKSRWADKTPSYANCLDLIERLYGPECRYVLVFRHGLDVACSMVAMGIPKSELGGREPYKQKLSMAATFWAERCEKILKFAERRQDRCIELRYETLCEEPEQEIRRLFAFLGEPFEEQVLQFHRQPHDTWIGLQDGKAALSSGFNANVGAWRERKPEEISAMLNVAGPMLARLGYSTEQQVSAPS